MTSRPIIIIRLLVYNTYSHRSVGNSAVAETLICSDRNIYGMSLGL